jgi:hypothetical protein
VKGESLLKNVIHQCLNTHHIFSLQCASGPGRPNMSPLHFISILSTLLTNTLGADVTSTLANAITEQVHHNITLLLTMLILSMFLSQISALKDAWPELPPGKKRACDIIVPSGNDPKLGTDTLCTV